MFHRDTAVGSRFLADLSRWAGMLERAPAPRKIR